MAEVPEKELVRNEDFSAYLGYASGIPSNITIKRTQDTHATLLSFDLDAVDAMGFCDASPLMRLPEAERGGAVRCLTQALEQHYGGKNLLAVPTALASTFQNYGFDSSPKTAEGAPYGRLLVSDMRDAARKVREITESGITQKYPVNQDVQLITDKQNLASMKTELSDLLINNASYANGESGEKAVSYTPEAMQARIMQDNVHAMAYLDMKTGKPVAFMRSYTEKGVGTYVTDLVVDKKYRGQGLGLRIIRDAAGMLPQDENKIFAIAADDKTQAFYENTLGFTSIAAAKQPIMVDNDKQFMFRMIPKREILLDLPAQLAPQKQTMDSQVSTATNQATSQEHQKHGKSARVVLAAAFAWIGTRLWLLGAVADGASILKGEPDKLKAVFNGELFKKLNAQVKDAIRDGGGNPDSNVAFAKTSTKVLKYTTAATIIGALAGGILGWVRGERVGSAKDIVLHPIKSLKLVFGRAPRDAEPHNAPMNTPTVENNSVAEKPTDNSQKWVERTGSQPQEVTQGVSR